MRDALVAIARGNVSAPPRMSAFGAHGKVSAMVGVAATTMIGKFISVFPGNHGTEIPTHQGCLVIFDERDGVPQAMVDTGAMTAVRTAVTTAVATDAIASASAEVLTIVGSGIQGRSHFLALQGVRPWSEVRLVSRHPEAFETWDLDIGDAVVADDVQAAVADAHVVTLCTSADQPVVRADWLAPDVHVSSIGGGHELDPALVDSGQLFVEWYGAAEHAHPAGAKELQSIATPRLTLVGDIISGTASVSRPRRTVYKSTGHPAEDAMAARALIEAARTHGIGQELAW